MANLKPGTINVRYFDNRRLVSYTPLDQAKEDARETLTNTEWAKIHEFVISGINANTKRMYRAHWIDFVHFCKLNRFIALPANPETIALYIATLAESGLKRSTITARLAAIVKIHDWRYASINAYENPGRDRLVKLALQGAVRNRVLARDTTRQVDALSPDDIGLLINQLPKLYPGENNALRVACYRALLLIGLAGGFRRSELVAIRLQDLRNTKHGIRITLPFSKTDQLGAGIDKYINRSVGSPLCPVAALEEWILMASLRSKSGNSWIFPSFTQTGKARVTHLSDRMVALLLQKLAQQAKFPNWRQLGGHSLRAGFITSALRQGHPEWKVRRQTGHRSSAAFNRYIRVQEDGSDAAGVF